MNRVWLWFRWTLGDGGRSYLWRRGWQEPSTAFLRCSPPHTHTCPGRIPHCSQSVALLQTQHTQITNPTKILLHTHAQTIVTSSGLNRATLQTIRQQSCPDKKAGQNNIGTGAPRESKSYLCSTNLQQLNRRHTLHWLTIGCLMTFPAFLNTERNEKHLSLHNSINPRQ